MLCHREAAEVKEMLSEKDQRWNKFVIRICEHEPSELSGAARFAVLCFDYDTEMNVGGHRAYFENYPAASPDTLSEALREVAGGSFAENFFRAFSEGEGAGWQTADEAFFQMKPSLSDCLMDYVEAHRDEIFA